MVSGGLIIAQSIALTSSIRNQKIIVFHEKPERVWAMDPKFYLEMWYNNPLRRDYIVDSKQHKDGSHYSQFINAPSAQPDTINAYLNASMCIVKQIDDVLYIFNTEAHTFTTIKPGDIKKFGQCWILITSVCQMCDNAPDFTITYQKMFTFEQFLKHIIAPHLSMQCNDFIAPIIESAMQSNVIKDECAFFHNLSQQQADSFQNQYIITRKEYTTTAKNLNISKLSLSNYFSFFQYKHSSNFNLSIHGCNTNL